MQGHSASNRLRNIGIFVTPQAQRITTRFYNDFRWLVDRGLRVEEDHTSNHLRNIGNQ